MRPHPWNDGFTWTDSRPRSGRLTSEQVEAFDRDGFFVLESVFGPDELAPVIEALDEYEGETDAFLKLMDGDRLSIAESGAIVFGVHPCVKYPAAKAFASHPVFADICIDLVGDDVRLYWDQLVYKKPDKPRRFPFHQDNGYGFVEPQQYLTCWVALTDATKSNGCPWIVPGVHRGGTIDHAYIEPLGFECFEDHADMVPVEAPAGSVVVFSSLTPHMTGANTTDAVRKSYIVQYAPDGAEVLRGEPADGPPATRESNTDPTRQFFVVQDGTSVAQAL